MHIGLIGGIGPAATDYYYRGLIERHARSNTTLNLTIVHADLRQLAQNRADRNTQRQAEIFLRLIQRLATAGAELAAITSMGGHFCVEELKKISPLPILNAIPEVEAAIRRRNLKTVGILGTRAVMETALYGGIPTTQVILPEGDALEEVDNNYALRSESCDRKSDAGSLSRLSKPLQGTVPLNRRVIHPAAPVVPALAAAGERAGTRFLEFAVIICASEGRGST